MTRRPDLGPQPAGPDDALSTDVPNSIAPHRAAAVPESRRPPRPDWTAGPQRLLVLGSAFDNAPVGMAVLTPAGVVALANQALGVLLNRSSTTLVGSTLFGNTHPDDRPAARHALELLHAGATRVARHECRFQRSDGTTVWVCINIAQVPRSPGRPAHLIAHVEDVTERKTFEAALMHHALHDALTGLPNRLLLAERIDHAHTGKGRHSRPHCLLYIDLNGFKAVNDRYGHSVGDQVLQQLAERIRGQLRPEDTAARLGGDEFAVLCVDVDPHQCAKIAERLRAAAAEPFAIDGRSISLTAAVGIGTSQTVGPAATDAAALLRQADRHMYEQKRRQPPSGDRRVP
jgi:diguanylate cyclase (GGDEF)-like protein/PAS domain S-box-containing protein